MYFFFFFFLFYIFKKKKAQSMSKALLLADGSNSVQIASSLLRHSASSLRILLNESHLFQLLQNCANDGSAGQRLVLGRVAVAKAHRVHLAKFTNQQRTAKKKRDKMKKRERERQQRKR
jgi:hypothetical protein